MIDYQFEKNNNHDMENIKSLLKRSNLPFEDIDDHYKHFIVATENRNLIGVVGLESYSNIGLLRSLAVEKDYRNRGLGKSLVNKMIEYSRSMFTKELFLLTTTAEKFFENFGFKVIERNKVPDAIKLTAEFKSICPVSAICMKKEI